MKAEYFLVKQGSRFALYTQAAYKQLIVELSDTAVQELIRVPFSAMQVEGQRLDRRYPIYDLEPINRDIYITNYDKL